MQDNDKSGQSLDDLLETWQKIILPWLLSTDAKRKDGSILSGNLCPIGIFYQAANNKTGLA